MKHFASSLTLLVLLMGASCNGTPSVPGDPTDASDPRLEDGGQAATSDAGSSADAGVPLDGGTSEDADAGSDAGALVDAGLLADAGSSAPDGGPTDSGFVDDETDAGSSDGWTYPPRAMCSGSYGEPTESDGVSEHELGEASGLAASPINPGILWSHNDSGGDARLFAIDVDGSARGALDLLGATSNDWEDLASAACPDGSAPCLWVEDTGTHMVYAVAEPTVPSSSTLSESSSDYWAYHVVYPVGVSPDVEALLVEPDGSAFYLIEKIQGDRARIFSGASSLEKTSEVTLTEAGSVESPGSLSVARDITGGDLHPSRSRLLLRTYLGVFEYRLAPGDFPGNLDNAERVDIAISLSLEASGEAVTYDHAGDGIFTLSEGILGIPGEPLHHFACVTP